MGQKVNPICLRLHPENKHFDSCWFSEKRYADSIHKDLNIGIYYNAILKQIQYPSASYLLEASPRKCRISFVFLNPKQLREQSFRQLGNVNSRNRKRKQNTLFSTKKETTPLYGLLEKKRKFLGLLPSYFLTAPFLQGFKERGSVFSKGRIIKERKGREKSEAFTRVEDFIFSSFLQVKKKDLQNKRMAVVSLQSKEKPTLLGNHKHITQLFTQFISFSDRKNRMPLLLSKTGRRFAPFLPQYTWQKGVELASRQNYLQLKKGACSSMLDLAISHYFVQRNLSGNFLSAASRFLLLQALSSFLKKGKDWSQPLGEFSQQERKSPSHVFHGVFAFDKVKNRHLVKKTSFLQDISFLQSKKDHNREEKGNTDCDILQSKMLPLYALHGGAQRGSPFSSERAANNLRALPSQPNKLTTRTNKEENGLLSQLQKSSVYTYHMESIISNRLKSSCKILLFRAQNVAQNALFIAEEIVYQLQRRNAFRQIKTKFLQEFANKSAIKGVRVTCVGRIGGRAKKAQRARGESFKMGQTSLHLFDSKVSFASKTALTPYGAVGVKVWVCWK